MRVKDHLRLRSGEAKFVRVTSVDLSQVHYWYQARECSVSRSEVESVHFDIPETPTEAARRAYMDFAQLRIRE